MSEKKRVPFLLDESPILVYPSLAKILKNVNKAIILQQVHFLLNVSKLADKKYNLVDSRWWVYNSYKEWQAYFPWLSMSAIKGLFGMLERDGLILSRQGVKDRWDRRKWYTIDYEAFAAFVQCNGQILSDVDETDFVQSDGQELSGDNKETETTTDKRDISAQKRAAKPRKPKKPTTPKELLDPMADAVMLAFGWSWDTASKNEKSKARGAAKGLCDIGRIPSEVPLFYAECKRRGWKDFSPNALLNVVSDVAKKATTRIIPLDDEPIVYPDTADYVNLAGVNNVG